MAQQITVNSRGMPSLAYLTKGEDDVTSIVYDFTLYFGSDTASTLAVEASSGLTVASSSVSGNKATVTISGGNSGATYDLKVKLTGTTETKEVITTIRVFDADGAYVRDYPHG
jgi:hypothetical protein